MAVVKNKVKPKTKSFNCRNCGSPVEIKILGQTLNVVCPSCKSIIDATDPNFKILEEGVSKRIYAPYIPLGTRGKLHGVLWEVTGFIVKGDSGYIWQEYLLFNPYHGYRWLVESDGHFSLFKRIHTRPKFDRSLPAYNYRKQKYKLFNRGGATVHYCEGEFFWRIKKGNFTRVEDYISPPFGLSLEDDKNEFTWTLGHHVERESVKSAFELDEYALPNSYGVGSLQPSDARDKLKKMIPVVLLSLVIMIGLQFARIMTAGNKLIYETRINKSSASMFSSGPLTFKNFKSPTFEVSGGKSNLMFEASALLRNAWVYMDILLVNEKTQKGIPVPIDISYYKGSDWSEGSTKSDQYIFNVPDGKYYLNINFREGDRKDSYKSIHLKIYRDVVMYSNFMIVSLLILIGPLVTLLRRKNFEARRWKNSDFSP